MAMVIPQMYLFKCLVLIINIISTISNGHARARILTSNTPSFDQLKGTIKSIKSYETGEVIDCVDIFKQPAINHPLLKNHTIEVKPSSNQKGNGAGYVEGALHQSWWKYGECPDGTIPIIRPQNHTNLRVAPLRPLLKNASGNKNSEVYAHEHAVVYLTGGRYTGAQAEINVWNPKVMDTGFSLAQIWVLAGDYEVTNSMEAGWMVSNPYPESYPRIFIYWTSDGYKQTGCYNLECPGFVQTNGNIALGALLDPYSTYDGEQYQLPIYIKRDNFTGRWGLQILNTEIGYWPSEIFTLLKDSADQINWGGEVVNAKTVDNHKATQMGSGHFASEGYAKAAFFHNLKFHDEGYTERDAVGILPAASNPLCYDLKLNAEAPNSTGVNFYYGGPGFSPQCVLG